MGAFLRRLLGVTTPREDAAQALLDVVKATARAEVLLRKLDDPIGAAWCREHGDDAMALRRGVLTRGS